MEKLGDMLGKDSQTGAGKTTKPSPSSSIPRNGLSPNQEGQDQDMVREMRALMLRASGLPLETRETHRLKLLKPRPEVKGLRRALQAAQDILAQKLAWLTLTGGYGTGKSHIALGVAWDWLEAGRHCRYTTASGMLERLKRTYDLTPEQAWENREPRFDTVFGWYCATPLLVLDDLGMVKLTDWALEKLDYLVDYRYLHRLPLLVTTNTVMGELPPRIADRLQDRRLGRVIVLSGPSYRTQG